MTDADNTGGAPANSGPAPGEELHIPKYRLDEALSEVRRLREEVGVKDRILNETHQRVLQSQQPAKNDLPTAEESGLDAQTYQAVLKLADKLVEKRLEPEKRVFEQQIGMLASRAEKAELLASRGAENVGLWPEIEKYQRDFYQKTGGFIPAETAMDILKGKEKDRKIQELEARLSAKGSQEAETHPVSAPGKSGTQQIPGGAQVPQTSKKSFSDMSVEEMEQAMEQQFSTGQRL